MSRAVLCLVAANVLGGLSYAASKGAMAGLPDITIGALRLAVALLCLAAWEGRRALRWGFHGRDLALLAVVGVLGFAAPLVLGNTGVRLSTSANASILILLEPVGIVLLSAAFLGARLGPGQAAGIAAGLAGALLVVTGGRVDPSLGDRGALLGNAILALHGILWSLYTVAAKPLLSRHSAADVTRGSLLLAFAALAPLALFEWRGWRPPEGTLLPALGWTAALGVSVTFLGVLLWNVGLRGTNPVAVASFIFLQPVVGVLAGRLAFGEPLTAWMLAGGALVGVGVLAAARGPDLPDAAPGPARPD